MCRIWYIILVMYKILGYCTFYLKVAKFMTQYFKETMGKEGIGVRSAGAFRGVWSQSPASPSCLTWPLLFHLNVQFPPAFTILPACSKLLWWCSYISLPLRHCLLLTSRNDHIYTFQILFSDFLPDETFYLLLFLKLKEQQKPWAYRWAFLQIIIF